MVPFLITNEDNKINTNQNVKPVVQMTEFFPTPIGFCNLDKAVIEKITESIKIEQMSFRKNKTNSVSSDLYILNRDELSDIKQMLTDSVNDYFKQVVNCDKDTELYITTSCININKNGDSHQVHLHRNSIVSAVLYIDTCEDDTISFVNPNTELFGNLRFTETIKTKWLIPEWVLPATTNTLIMVPSTLPHFVSPRPNICKGTRVSLAFNTWIKGGIGGDENSADQLRF